MPLIIGELNARIEVDEGAERVTPATVPQAASPLDEEARQMRALAAARFAKERRIDQRDPDLLGGG